MSNVYIMVGLPGSGKSTWIKNNIPGVTVISRDIIRSILGYTSGPDEKAVCTKEQEDNVTIAEYDAMQSCLNQGIDFVIDDTNTGAYRTKLIDFLRNGGAYITMVYLKTPVDVCAEFRKNYISSDVMQRISNKLVPPKDGEYDELIVVER